MADAHLETAEETELIARATAPTSTAEYNAANDFGDDDAPWSHPSGATIDVQNVVATVNLRISIDLRTLALSARNAEYNPKKFASSSCPRAAVHGLGFAAIIRKIGFQPKFGEFKVQNMVATSDAGFPIRLEALVYAHAKFSSYEPELFPGLIYRLVIPKTVLLLFVSGRMVLTGGKSLGHLRTAFEKMYPVLTEFKKESLPYEVRSPAAAPLRAIEAEPQPALELPMDAAEAAPEQEHAPPCPRSIPRIRLARRPGPRLDAPRASPSAALRARAIIRRGSPPGRRPRARAPPRPPVPAGGVAWR
ncbi:hypothetical protein JL722_10905 [Aureococcus anophagefferens]|nr:hypothetical protein JL722_10905 [Aureococcus anophagefferens]